MAHKRGINSFITPIQACALGILYSKSYVLLNNYYSTNRESYAVASVRGINLDLLH